MIIADLDDLKKARRVLFTISLFWIALDKFQIDLTNIGVFGVRIGVTQSQAELSLLLTGMYTLFVFLAHSYKVGSWRYFEFLNDREKIIVQNISDADGIMHDDLNSYKRPDLSHSIDKLERERVDFEFTTKKRDLDLSFSYFVILDLMPPVLLFGYCIISFFDWI